jgi:outer membrane protein TolC
MRYPQMVPASCNLSRSCRAGLLRVGATLLLLLVPGMVHGQDPPEVPEAGKPLILTLQAALEYARTNSREFQTAVLDTQLAKEDRRQAHAALLPKVDSVNQYVYTQPNGADGWVYVGNDGVHVYNVQVNVHQELSLAALAEFRRANRAAALAQARQEVAARGMVATVVQAFYEAVVAQRRVGNARLAEEDARRLTDITQKREQAGEVAHADFIKAQLVLQRAQREVQDAQLEVEKAKLGLVVLLFADYQQDFQVADDLQDVSPLAPFEEVSRLAAAKNPDLRAAELALKQEEAGIGMARAGYAPSLSFDYFYGINADKFATSVDGVKQLGSSAQVTLSIPIWNWGATRSKVVQAQLRARQAQRDLNLAQRQAMANLQSFYGEARTAFAQVDSLKQSAEISAESLRLTLLQYQEGEASILEVVDAQSAMVQARDAYDGGLARYRLALANLQTLTGVL